MGAVGFENSENTEESDDISSGDTVAGTLPSDAADALIKGEGRRVMQSVQRFAAEGDWERLAWLGNMAEWLDEATSEQRKADLAEMIICRLLPNEHREPLDSLMREWWSMSKAKRRRVLAEAGVEPCVVGQKWYE